MILSEQATEFLEFSEKFEDFFGEDVELSSGEQIAFLMFIKMYPKDLMFRSFFMKFIQIFSECRTSKNTEQDLITFAKSFDAVTAIIKRRSEWTL